jgi:hypothetical protein
MDNMTIEYIKIALMALIIYYLGSLLTQIRSISDKISLLERDLKSEIEECTDKIRISVESMHSDLMTEEDEVRSLVKAGIPMDVARDHVYINRKRQV